MPFRMLSRPPAAVLLLCGAVTNGCHTDQLNSPTKVNHDDMVNVPAGEFTMGTTPEQVAELAARYNVHESLFGLEVPQRKVYVPAFLIDRYSVTNRQYQAFVEATGHKPPDGWKGSEYPRGQGDFPVTGVSWRDAEAYARWAGKRLPTEEEWEKAARGMDGRFYPWGNEWTGGACRMGEAKQPGDDFGLAPVGSYPLDVSPYGALDMAGNVAEWTGTQAKNALPWTGFHIVKGGSWVLSQPYNFRCAAKTAQSPGTLGGGRIGFRCAMDATEASLSAEEAEPRPVKRNFTSGKLPHPRLDLYMKEPIKLVPKKRGKRVVGVEVPYLPGNDFRLNILESPLDLPSGRPYAFSPDHTVATNNWREPPDVLGRIEAQVTLEGGLDCVTVRYRLKNIGEHRREFKVNTCFNPADAPGFRDHDGTRTLVLTDEGFVPIIRFSRRVYDRILCQVYPASLSQVPFMVVVSRDGQWVIAQVSDEVESFSHNLEHGCQHSEPGLSLDPGEEKVVQQKVYYLRANPEQLLKRWRHDFPLKGI